MLPMKSLALLEKAFSVLSGGRTTNKPMLYSLPTEGERPIFVHLTISVGFTKPQVSQRQKFLPAERQRTVMLTLNQTLFLFKSLSPPYCYYIY